ncbi:hypothetical protein DNHGIG_32300 [Collibacillus ludicampi]|uniref:Uncharacterized protein n=1 Tax=Collibacillus ludicampi TaxID=2771369 RepID=A0AAV4LIM1_9BACL|nr:hypothetical protein [Collibacillus ludicampi]GIM47681.1 hypothetical protein DNHGIG_32300 [Collibacillus ludicampi]
MERILRMWAPLGITEVAHTIFPWWCIGAVASFIWHARWLDLVTVAGALYVLSSGISGRVTRWWSRNFLGLRRYIVVPIPRWVAGVLIRGRMNLPRGKHYFLLHVRDDRGLEPRRMAREMQRDIRCGVQAEWTNHAVFLGNTFGSLGRLQEKFLQEWGDVEIIEGTFFPLQTLFLKPERYQRKMFGRVLSKETKWKIVKFEVREKEVN